MLSDMRRNSRFKGWSDAGKLARVRLDPAVRMKRWNREMETLMAQKRLTMRQIHEILRLKYQNQLSVREIARSCGLAVSTVGDYVQRAEAAGLTWPLPEGLTEEGFDRSMMYKIQHVDEINSLVRIAVVRFTMVHVSYRRVKEKRR